MLLTQQQQLCIHITVCLSHYQLNLKLDWHWALTSLLDLSINAAFFIGFQLAIRIMSPASIIENLQMQRTIGILLNSSGSVFRVAF